MTRIYAKFRRRLLADNHFTRYLAYAAGEILLVVIGILIALQINNWNDARKDRKKELIHLANIRTDLVANIERMDEYLKVRNGYIATARRILEHFNGKPIEDVSAFNADGLDIYNWKRFYLDNNAYQDLVNSGNFSLLSNPKVKSQLLDIETLYLQMKGEEDHYRFDTETTLYKPIYEMMDSESMIADVEHKLTGGKAGRKDAIDPRTFDAFLQSKLIKNGFVMTVLQYGTMNEQMTEMRRRCKTLIDEIDAQVARDG